MCYSAPPMFGSRRRDEARTPRAGDEAVRSPEATPAGRRPTVPAPLAEALAEAAAPRDHLSRELRDVEAALRAKGLAEEAADLGAVREEASAFRSFRRRLGSRLGTLADGLKKTAAEQWQLVGQELSQSREVMSLLARRMSGEIKSFSPAEEELVRRQVADVFRMVPATALALAPVPGIAIVTPFVLKKLDLLPSAWREAHVIHKLETTASRLRGKGEIEEADRLARMARELEAQSRDREDRARTLRELPGVRLMYDFDMDGTIDDREWEAIKADRAALRRLAAGEGPLEGETADDAWYFTTEGEVEGPVTLETLRALPLPEHALVHAPGIDHWIPYDLFCEALAPE